MLKDECEDVRAGGRGTAVRRLEAVGLLEGAIDVETRMSVPDAAMDHVVACGGGPGCEELEAERVAVRIVEVPVGGLVPEAPVQRHQLEEHHPPQLGPDQDLDRRLGVEGGRTSSSTRPPATTCAPSSTDRSPSGSRESPARIPSSTRSCGEGVQPGAGAGVVAVQVSVDAVDAQTGSPDVDADSAVFDGGPGRGTRPAPPVVASWGRPAA
ncbi:hypothetical protein [Streptomyces hundungensis]|uniref:hypothetical protein n=1 Tax=Streptomyces hundungensis TaxID=1077946 RepID=UPI0033FA7622